MSFWSKLIGVGTGGLFGDTLFSKGDKKETNPDGTPKNDIYSEIKSLLGVYTGNAGNQQGGIKGIGDFFKTTGQQSVNQGLTGLTDLTKFYSDIMSGKTGPNMGLDFFNSPEITQNQDENQRLLEEFGVRGGRRAADLSSTQLARESNLNKAYQAFKSQAPGALGNLHDRILGYGQQASTLALGAYSDIADKYLQQFGIELGGRQNESDRKAGIINGVLAAAGSALGAAAAFCFTGDTRILTNHGWKAASDLKDTDRLKASSDTNRLITYDIYRIRKKDNQQCYEVRTYDGTTLKCTDTHLLITSLEPYGEMIVRDLSIDDEVMLLDKGRIYTDRIRSITKIPELQTVYMVKIDNNDTNFMFVTNNFLSVDDYIDLSTPPTNPKLLNQIITEHNLIA
jgi:hypothetical protein